MNDDNKRLVIVLNDALRGEKCKCCKVLVRDCDYAKEYAKPLPTPTFYDPN